MTVPMTRSVRGAANVLSSAQYVRRYARPRNDYAIGQPVKRINKRRLRRSEDFPPEFAHADFVAQFHVLRDEIRGGRQICITEGKLIDTWIRLFDDHAGAHDIVVRNRGTTCRA